MSPVNFFFHLVILSCGYPAVGSTLKQLLWWCIALKNQSKLFLNSYCRSDMCMSFQDVWGIGIIVKCTLSTFCLCRYGATRAVVVATVCTFFEFFNIPVFWPILVMYFIVLFIITMKRQIKVRNDDNASWWFSSPSSSKFDVKWVDKKRKGTLFKCQVCLSLRHTNWGHVKLKLTSNLI